MRNIYSILIFYKFVFILLILNWSASAQEINVGKLVTTLSHDTFEGRDPGTSGMESAVRFIESTLSIAGIKPYFDSGYRDSFMAGSVMTYNLIGFIPASEATDQYVILSAHLDHLGSIEDGEDQVYNGANDNASGVSSVIKIADQLKSQRLNYNVMIVLFSAEESGLLGSKHMAQWIKNKNVNLEFVINLEMLGVPYEIDKDKIYMTGWDYSDLGKIFNESIGKDLFVKFEMGENYQLFKHSDNYPFYELLGIPAHTFSTFDLNSYPYYHHLDDEVEALDLEHLEHVTQELYSVIRIVLRNNIQISMSEDK